MKWEDGKGQGENGQRGVGKGRMGHGGWRDLEMSQGIKGMGRVGWGRGARRRARGG